MLEIDPLVYQGGSGVLLGPRDDLTLADSEWGLDFESEVAVILGYVPRGTTASHAATHVRLVLLANDVKLWGERFLTALTQPLTSPSRPGQMNLSHV